MIRLTNLADYGVMLMAEIAAAEHIVQSSYLAERTGLPGPTIAKILNLLAKGELLISHRGQKGGFALARAAQSISVGEIVECLDGPIALTNCTTDQRLNCGFESNCRTRPYWGAINSVVRKALTDVSLQSLTQDSKLLRPEKLI